MEKLKFHFVVLEAVDGTDILCIDSVMTQDDRTFEIPHEVKAAGKHAELALTNAFKRIKNTLKKEANTETYGSR